MFVFRDFFETVPHNITSALCASIYEYWSRPSGISHNFGGHAHSAVPNAPHNLVPRVPSEDIALRSVIFACLMLCGVTEHCHFLHTPTGQCDSFRGIRSGWEGRRTNQTRVELQRAQGSLLASVFCNMSYLRVRYGSLARYDPAAAWGQIGELVSQSSEISWRWRHQRRPRPARMHTWHSQKIMIQHFHHRFSPTQLR